MAATMQTLPPERIWLDDVEHMHAFASSEDCEGCLGGKGTEYVRAAMIPAMIAAARNAALKEAAAVCVDRGRMSIIGRHYQRAEAEQDCSDAILALIKEDGE